MGPRAWKPMSCQECGQNMGPSPAEHVCNQDQMIAHQAEKFKLEIDKKLEPDMQDYLASPKGQFMSYLIKRGDL